ncbi:hypothetical protein IQ249_23350 [Lusitaniella coriacea LEGE 07157]|uniref:PA14 domain-containing protein n=1 Tax=Lusitaniella coriacea LEGE 07157 TaxID=945747 RepID=A0A8J7JFK7_9CYAN|nr:hypothetical protein [Lusitaniella coriacea LEGE 07157]
MVPTTQLYSPDITPPEEPPASSACMTLPPFTPLYSETYTFRTPPRAIVKLWIDDVLVLDGEENSPENGLSNSVDLVAGDSYEMRACFYGYLPTTTEPSDDDDDDNTSSSGSSTGSLGSLLGGLLGGGGGGGGGW